MRHISEEPILTPSTGDAFSGTGKQTHYWILAAILLLALGLRLVRLGSFSFWHDEVASLLCSEFLWDLVSKGHLASNHPPMPYILLAGWRALGMGPSEWSLRLLSVCFGTATIWAIYHLGATLFDRRTGLIAALLLAVSPFHVLHSQDLKEYIFLPFVALLMGACLYRAVIGEGNWRDWLGYGLLAGIGCYTEIFVGPLLVALNLWAMACMGRSGRQWVRWFTANALGAAMFLPWLAIMVQKAQATMVDSTRWWIPAPTLWTAAIYFKTIAYGYAAGKPWFYMATLAFGLLLLLGLAAGLSQRWRAVAFLAMWFFPPVAMVFAISQVTQSIFLMRAMLPFAMGAYLLAALGVTSANTRRLRRVLLGGTVLLSSMGLAQYYFRDYPPLEFPHRPGIHGPKPFEQAARHILANWREGDQVFHGSQSTWLPFLWYGLREKPQSLAGGNQGFIDYFEKANPRNTPNPIMKPYYPRPVQALAEQCAGRIWYVFAEWERENLSGNATVVWDWLDAHYTEIGRTSFKDIQLRLYAPQNTCPVAARMWDDGAQASCLQGTPPAAYLWEGANNGLIDLSVEQRRGRLRVSFDEGAADTPPALLIENRSDASVACTAEMICSDGMIDLAALWKDDPGSDIWRVSSRTNPTPPPANYPLHTLLGDPAFGTGCAHGDRTLTPGNYQAWLHQLGPAPCEPLGVAPITITANGVPFASDECEPGTSTVQWMWTPATELITPDTTGKLTLRAHIEPLSEKQPGYACLGQVCLVRAGSDLSVPSQVPLITEAHTLVPGASQRIPIPTQQGLFSRIDAWVCEQGEGGKAYHVFQTMNPKTNPTPPGPGDAQ